MDRGDGLTRAGKGNCAVGCRIEPYWIKAAPLRFAAARPRSYRAAALGADPVRRAGQVAHGRLPNDSMGTLWHWWLAIFRQREGGASRPATSRPPRLGRSCGPRSETGCGISVCEEDVTRLERTPVARTVMTEASHKLRIDVNRIDVRNVLDCRV